MQDKPGLQTPTVDLDAEGEAHIPLTVPEKLQESLSELGRGGGLTGWIADTLMSAGDWVEREREERRQMIGGIENLWLLLTSTADFNPVCAGTYTMRGKLSVDALDKAFARQAKKFPRYRQRLTSIGRRFHTAKFEADPDFDIRNHVRAVQLPEPAGKKELDDLMGQYIAEDWDLRRPLWSLLLVENYHDDDGAECALLTRAHHSLADGQGFVISQLYMTSYHDVLIEAMEQGARKLHAAKHGQLPPSQVHRSLKFLDPLTTHVLTAPLVEFGLAFLFWSVYAVSTVVSLFWSTWQMAHQVTLFLLTCWRIEMLTAYQPGPRVIEREFSCSKRFSIEDVRLCQQAFSGPRPGYAVKGVPKEQRKQARSKVGHVTLNDMICAVVVDVLAKEIERKPKERGPWGRAKVWFSKVLPSPIAFFIPISVRSPGDWSMRNLSTGSIVYLHPSDNLTSSVSTKKLHRHMHECRAELSLLKHSLGPKMLFYIAQSVGQLPVLWPAPLSPGPESRERIRHFIRTWFTTPLAEFLLQSMHVVLTNVPGPAKRPISLEGVEIINWTALPPQAGKGTIGMGIISYAGGISISVAADMVPASRGVCRRICEGFEERFELYVERAKEILSREE